MKEVRIMIEAYMKLNPNSEDPMIYLYFFGVEGIKEMLEKANNRPITFKRGENLDEVSYTIMA